MRLYRAAATALALVALIGFIVSECHSIRQTMPLPSGRLRIPGSGSNQYFSTPDYCLKASLEISKEPEAMRLHLANLSRKVTEQLGMIL